MQNCLCRISLNRKCEILDILSLLNRDNLFKNHARRIINSFRHETDKIKKYWRKKRCNSLNLFLLENNSKIIYVLIKHYTQNKLP